MGRFGASRGMVASSPTAGSPLVSMRSTGSAGAAWVNVIPEDAVYPPERSTGVAVSADDKLIRRRRYRTSPTISATTTRTAMTAIAIHKVSDTTPLSQGG
jgi:hypothetical protein